MSKPHLFKLTKLFLLLCLNIYPFPNMLIWFLIINSSATNMLVLHLDKFPCLSRWHIHMHQKWYFFPLISFFLKSDHWLHHCSLFKWCIYPHILTSLGWALRKIIQVWPSYKIFLSVAYFLLLLFNIQNSTE